MRRSQFFQLRHLTCFLALSAMLFSAQAQSNDLDEVNQLLKSGKQAQALAKVEQSLSSKPRDAQMRFLKGVMPSAHLRSSLMITQSYLSLTTI